VRGRKENRREGKGRDETRGEEKKIK